MIAKLRRNWRLSMCMCVVGLGLALFCLGRYTAFGQEGGGPTVQFSSSSFTSGTCGSEYAVITVTLSQSSTSTVTVFYWTNDGTAVAGTNYVEVNGTLTFSPGTTSQTFQVPIIEDSASEGNLTVNLNLAGVSGGNATLGSPNTAILTIMDCNTCS
jgi:fibronectin-binding autotransporter adhesin